MVVESYSPRNNVEATCSADSTVSLVDSDHSEMALDHPSPALFDRGRLPESEQVVDCVTKDSLKRTAIWMMFENYAVTVISHVALGGDLQALIDEHIAE